MMSWMASLLGQRHRGAGGVAARQAAGVREARRTARGQARRRRRGRRPWRRMAAARMAVSQGGRERRMQRRKMRAGKRGRMGPSGSSSSSCRARGTQGAVAVGWRPWRRAARRASLTRAGCLCETSPTPRPRPTCASCLRRRGRWRRCTWCWTGAAGRRVGVRGGLTRVCSGVLSWRRCTWCWAGAAGRRVGVCVRSGGVMSV